MEMRSAGRARQSGPENGARRENAAVPPYLLVSAALNLAGSRDLTRKDRKSGYFLFSKYFCGSRQTGYRETETYARRTHAVGARPDRVRRSRGHRHGVSDVFRAVVPHRAVQRPAGAVDFEPAHELGAARSRSGPCTSCGRRSARPMSARAWSTSPMAATPETTSASTRCSNAAVR